MSVQELYAWSAYFSLKSDRENEAYEKQKDKPSSQNTLNF